MKYKPILLSVCVLLFSLEITAQDLIYKSDGKIINAKILDLTGKSLSYQLPGQNDGLTYFISVNIVDSIIYQNGKKDIFYSTKSIISAPILTSDYLYNHHLIGIDLAGLVLYKNLTLSYEFLPGKARIGYKIIYSKLLNNPKYYEYDYLSFSRSFDWSIRTGINYYIFPPKTFRFGTGLYYLYGSNSIPEYTYDPINYSETPGITSHKNSSGLILDLFGFYNLTNNLAINFGFNIPISIKTNNNASLLCEFLLNF